MFQLKQGLMYPLDKSKLKDWTLKTLSSLKNSEERFIYLYVYAHNKKWSNLYIFAVISAFSNFTLDASVSKCLHCHN